MSNATLALRRRIGRATELQSVVRTMKALAAANIGQYENSVRALADYDRTVSLGLGACFRLADAAGRLPPSGQPRPAVETAAIIFGSDQGLVGQFNERVVDHAIAMLAHLSRTTHLWAVGERVTGGLAAAGLELTASFAVPTSVQGIAPLVTRLLEAVEANHRHGAVSELYLFYNRALQGAIYAPTDQRLLPLDERWRSELVLQRWPSKYPPEVLCSDTVTLRSLVREYLFISLFRACAESLASENGSRLAAMERADRNIEELLDTLKHGFHQLRQSDIDEELFDLVSGAELLRDSSA